MHAKCTVHRKLNWCLHAVQIVMNSEGYTSKLSISAGFLCSQDLFLYCTAIFMLCKSLAQKFYPFEYLISVDAT
jgi:hypothetical protein